VCRRRLCDKTEPACITVIFEKLKKYFNTFDPRAYIVTLVITHVRGLGLRCP